MNLLYDQLFYNPILELLTIFTPNSQSYELKKYSQFWVSETKIFDGNRNDFG